MAAQAAAQALAGRLGGTLVEEDPHAFLVKDTAIGDVSLVLDSRLFHLGKDKADSFLRPVGAAITAWIGSAASYVLPCEMVTGPIAIADLHRVDDALSALRKVEARGTQDGLLYAFGLHFNVETPRREIAAILPIFKSFILLNAWLRRQVAPDATRSLLGFADPFPIAFVRQVVAPGYAPDLPTFVEDYIAANPTRNRDLDLLPLLRFLAEDQVLASLPHEKIGKRPTFHYRLPDARVSDPGWSIAPDWNRWVAIERLAYDTERLERVGAAYLAFAGETKSWADLSERLAFA